MKVQGYIKNLIEENFKDDLEKAMRDPILFGDFRTALSEGEPRVYEDIQDYDAAKAVFQVLCISLELCLILSLCLRNGQEPVSYCGQSVSFLCVHNFLCTVSHLGAAAMKTEGQLQSQQCFPIVYFP